MIEYILDLRAASTEIPDVRREVEFLTERELFEMKQQEYYNNHDIRLYTTEHGGMGVEKRKFLGRI